MSGTVWQENRGAALEAMKKSVLPMSGAGDDYAPLIALIAQARIALLGNATLGSSELQLERARLTSGLFETHRYDAIAIDADWRDALGVDRYVRGASENASAEQALRDFRCFPRWMWRNRETAAFVEWLRAFNMQQPPDRRVGFYGLDFYSHWATAAETLEYLEQADPAAAVRARYRYGCFDHCAENNSAADHITAFDIAEACEHKLVAKLADAMRNAACSRPFRDDIRSDADFYARQHARLAGSADAYYRAMFHERVSACNLRAQHLADLLLKLDRHLSRTRPARIVVWSHNFQIGDASATEMGENGATSVGHLMRRHHGRDAVMVGFTTYRGSVCSASEWGAPSASVPLQAAASGSYEALMHDAGVNRGMLMLRDDMNLKSRLSSSRLQRGIGVLYSSVSERVSHYCHARLARQFDAVVHLDHSQALRPLNE